jgi:hypothetical protein
VRSLNAVDYVNRASTISLATITHDGREIITPIWAPGANASGRAAPSLGTIRGDRRKRR